MTDNASSAAPEPGADAVNGGGPAPRERVGVIGAGYVGLVTGVCLASMGYEVTLRDIDANKVAALNDGQVPIYEPGLVEMMSEHRDRLTYTLSLERMLERSEVVFIAVDTPPTYSGDADLSRVMSVVEELEKVGADARHVLVMKSTVPVGTGERVRAELDARGLEQVGYCSNPEFLKEGAAIADFLRPDRVVIGSFDDAQGDRVAALYAPLGAPIIRTSVPSAEMVKYASNAFLATKISFINEIANVCEEVGADVEVVAHGMGLDSRIGSSFLRAGIGFGGSCFPKDVSALKQLAGNSGYHFQLLTSVIEVNELQKRRVIGKLKKHLGTLEGKRVALLGLAFKPETDDMREASSLVLAARLLAEGAEVVAYDPVVEVYDRLHGVSMTATAEEAMAGADAAVLVTEWAAIVGLDWAAAQGTMRSAIVIDGRNALDPREMTRLGYAFEGIGRIPAHVGAPL
ncbi:UDP-glucose dehydrogenase family protein [Miltoncostaea oceani]|uniref:UDP-glucose dehydrogenase family protein n=1 Tax=Miltoncostaea oceani TaxID=2843216 RepID=UPI001C3D8A6F|nr:UDP-glucose/GDP-mannose dehydrogenase family protein [Miltoncostaea oceani]